MRSSCVWVNQLEVSSNIDYANVLPARRRGIAMQVHEKANPLRGGDAKPRTSGEAAGLSKGDSSMYSTPSPEDSTAVSRNAANVAEHTQRNHGAMKRVALLAISAILATMVAIGFLAVDQVSATAPGGNVTRCGGGKIFLDAKEKRTFALHNEIRRKHHLPTFCVHPALEKAARDH